ncbi:MAG: carbohydrate-binding domain-containing protein [Oscillospiraceae bacterium]|nr:carbohydrate-binding domain-containing protein [Oscillospiraceae bacterium]
MKGITRKLPSALLAVVLAAALLLGLLPFAASAVDTGSADNTFTFTDSGVTAASDTGGGYKISGTALTINAAGTYRIMGSCADGSITVKKGTTGVTLILDDLTLTSSATAPLSCNKATEVTLVVSGTVTLTDAEDPANETSADETVADAFEGAAIKVKSGASLLITGTGTLTADGSGCKNGIKGASTAAITVGVSASDSLALNVKAAYNGLASDGTLTIAGGTVNVTAGNDGVKSDPDADDTDSEGVLTITGGTVNVFAGDDGIKAYYDVVIGTEGSSVGPVINITKSCEGIEGATVTLWSGSGRIVASDDGINAANSDLAGYDFLLTVAGGSWYVNAGGDGLDSNGSIVNSGGSIEVYGAADNGNAAVDYGDYNASWTVSGGEIIAVGMSGMAVTPTSGSYLVFGSSGMGGGMPGSGWPFSAETTETAEAETAASDAAATDFGGPGGMPGGQQPGGGTGSSISISAGSTLAVKDSAGNTVWSGTAPKSANWLLYAGSGLTSGTTYTLYVNGSAAATATVASGSQQGGMQPGQGGDPGQGGMQPGQGGFQPGTQPTQTVGGFTDVTESSYYAPAVIWAVQQSVTNGTSAATFSPDASCTRAQAVTFLWRAAGSPEPTSTTCPFTDVSSSAYYYKAVLWAYENGVTEGTTASTFSPDATVTRAQVVTFLCRALSGSASGTNPFSDVSGSDYFYDAVLWAVAKNVTNGTTATTFSPSATCTRAQIVTFLYRAYNG